MKPPETIYLIQYGHDTADLSWCEDPAPEKGMDEKDSIEYHKVYRCLACKSGFFTETESNECCM